MTWANFRLGPESSGTGLERVFLLWRYRAFMNFYDHQALTHGILEREENARSKPNNQIMALYDVAG